jgi:hypothetical protein
MHSSNSGRMKGNPEVGPALRCRRTLRVTPVDAEDQLVRVQLPQFQIPGGDILGKERCWLDRSCGSMDSS